MYSELLKHNLPSIYVSMGISCMKFLKAGELFVLNISIKYKWEEDLASLRM